MSADVFTSKGFRSKDGTESISIVRRLASSIKPTFFQVPKTCFPQSLHVILRHQVTDISKYGDVKAVGELVLPRQRTLMSSAVRILRQDPVDTGTMAGVIEQEDISIYR